MIEFKEWLAVNHPDFEMNEDWKKWARNAAVGGALLGAGMGLGSYNQNTSQQPQPQSQQQVQTVDSQSSNLQDGLQQGSDGTWVYIADAPPAGRANQSFMNAITAKAQNAYMQQTGSDMQGVTWGVKQVGGKVGIWFK